VSVEALQIGDPRLEDVVRAVHELWADGLSIQEATDKVLASVDLDPEVQYQLARKGLYQLCGELASRGRKTESGWSFHSKFQPRGPNAKELKASILGRLPLQAADGSTKAILDFDLADVDYFVSLAKARMDGWKSRHGAMRGIRRLMDEHQAVKVVDLPLDALAQASRWVEEAWS
jgi:hypothetical protein